MDAGIRTGLNKGYLTTPIPKTVRPSHLKGKQSTKTTFVRSIIREVVGFAPYERRVMELLRNSKVCGLIFGARNILLIYIQDKKARKLTKKRVSGHDKNCCTNLTPFPARDIVALEAEVGGAWKCYPREQEGCPLSEFVLYRLYSKHMFRFSAQLCVSAVSALDLQAETVSSRTSQPCRDDEKLIEESAHDDHQPE